VNAVAWVAAVLCGVAIVAWPLEGATRAVDAALETPRRSWPRGRDALAHWTSLLARSRSRPDLVPLLDALSAALRAGLSTSEALRLAARTADPGELLTPVVRAADEGRPLGHEWRRLARTVAHPDLAALAQAWTISDRLGCPLADAAATSAATARARIAVARRLDAATAGARATSAMLSLLPLGGLALALLLGLTPIELYGHGAAAVAGLAGLGLLVLGRWMVRRMVARVSAAVC